MTKQISRDDVAKVCESLCSPDLCCPCRDFRHEAAAMIRSLMDRVEELLLARDNQMARATSAENRLVIVERQLAAANERVEALPELLDAALYMRAKRIEHGGGDEEDGIFENDVRCFDAALAKLKARL